MPIFKVKAYDLNGDLKSFRKEAVTEDELLRTLGFEGYVPISLQLEKNKDGKKESKPLKLEDQHMFCSMLSAFLLSGLSLTEVLRLLQRQTRDKRLQPIFSELRESVESGRSLAQSMKSQGVFQDFLIGMVESGERSSSLPDILEKASALLQSQITLRRKISSALTYPILMLVVGFFVVAFLIAYVVPQLTGIIVDSGEALPLATRILLAMSTVIKNAGLPTLLILFLVYLYMKRKGKRIRLPIFRDVRNLLTVSMLFSQLSTLIKTGVPLVQALEMSEPMDPVKGRVHFLAEEVRKGYRFSQSLERQGTFSEDVIAIVRIGEVGGNLPECLDRISANSWEFAQTSMQKWSSLAEPIIIMVLGVVVGFVVLAVLLPIFNLSDLAGI